MQRQRRKVVCLVALLETACGTLTGLDGYHVATHRVSTDAGSAPKFHDAACGDCVTRHCRAELAACATDGKCAPWERCTAGCAPGDDDCLHGCFPADLSLDAAMYDVDACTAQSCQQPCQAVYAGASVQSAACGAAYRSSCGGELSAAFYTEPTSHADAHCLFENDCASSGHANPGCSLECGDRNDRYAPNGALLPFYTCGWIDAFSVCGWDDLSCAGKYLWPLATSARVDITVRANDGGYPEASVNPLPGLAVRACEVVVGCTSSSVTQQTGPDGLAHFTLPTNGPGNAGRLWSFEVSTGWADGPRTVLFHSGRALNRDTLLSLPLNPGAFAALASPENQVLLGTPWQEDKGTLVVEARACAGAPFKGFEVRVDGGADPNLTTVYFKENGDPVPSLGPDTLIGLVQGIEPDGLHVVSAWYNGEKFAEGRVVTRAGALTAAYYLYPLSAQGD